MSTKQASKKPARPAGSKRTAAEESADVKPLKARKADHAAQVARMMDATREAVDGLLKADASLKAGKARVAGSLTAGLGESHLAVSRVVVSLKHVGVPASESTDGKTTIADMLTAASVAENGSKPRRKFSAAHVSHYVNLAPRVEQVLKAAAVVHAKVDAPNVEAVDIDQVAPLTMDGHAVMTVKPAAERGHWDDTVRAFTSAYMTACRKADADGEDRPDWMKVFKAAAKASTAKTMGDRARALMDEINDADKATLKAHQGALEGLQRALSEAL